MSASAIDGCLDLLRNDEKLKDQLVETLHLPPTPANLAELRAPLHPQIEAALGEQGISSLYSHQTEALDGLSQGRSVLVTTPTSSGKSLIFYLPVIEEVLNKGDGRALFLFPLKALGQDQKGKFDELMRMCGVVGALERAEIYDGDTPREKREAIRATPPRVLISNPDMLHLGILPSWAHWSEFLGQLRWVVLDELHVYRGIFGTHFHHVLGRLMRLCRRCGSDPQIVASSATVANAKEFAETLAGRSFHVVCESGAPREGRHVLFFQPESSPYTLSLQLLIHCLESGLKTIVFTKARRITELLYSWLERQRPDLASQVTAYRSGFLASERRQIEKALFEGRLDGVISTSALEMGIDVGGLDACILVGYPGSVMATWQRSGRVGRSDRDSITALVALPDALDQYLLRHPLDLVGRPFEQLIVDPDNPQVARSHLLCSASESPLDTESDTAFMERYRAVIENLIEARDLLETEHGTWVAKRRRPQRDVSLRGPSGSWVVVDEASERVIGTIDGVRVFHECHPGAVYLHAGKQYLISSLDHEGERALAQALRVDYFTRAKTEKETEILEVLDHRTDGPLQAWLGRLLVTEQVVGFERKTLRAQELIDQHELDLPPMRFETVGLWWAVPPEQEAHLRAEEFHFMGALHASEHAAISLFPLLALCDRNDIGGISIPLHPQVGSGGVFIYDGHPGGVGIAARGFRDLPKLLNQVVDLLHKCDCEEGCPSCVHSPKCGNGNRPLDKLGALASLRLLLGQEELPEGVVARPVELNLENRPLLEVDGLITELAPVPPNKSEEVANVPAAQASVQSVPLETADQIVRPERDLAPSRSVKRRPPAPITRPRRKTTPARGRRVAIPKPSEIRQTVLFDLETQKAASEVGGWGRSYRMRVAIGVTCLLEEGQFEVFDEERVPELIALLESADLVVGFNIARFDYDVLAGYTGIDYLRKLPTLDLLEDVHGTLGFRLSLNHLAQETLGSKKSADGLQSLEWYKQGRLDLIEEYCRMDVQILRDLYLFGRRMGFLWYRDKEKRRLKLPVDW